MEGYLGTPHSQSCTSETGKFTTYFFYQCENFETKLFNLMETWTILEQLDEGVGSLLVRTQYRNSWLYSSQEFLPWFGFSFVYADFGSYITSYCMCKQQTEDFSIKIIKKQYWVGTYKGNFIIFFWLLSLPGSVFGDRRHSHKINADLDVKCWIIFVWKENRLRNTLYCTEYTLMGTEKCH